MTMRSIPHYDGPEGKRPICQKCYEKAAVVLCNKCSCFLCMDCRQNHTCEDKKNNGRKK
jgi:hypothetical protein